MRRSTKIAVVLAAATLALAGCAKDDNKSSSGGSTTVLNCDDLTGDGPKVGIAYDVGGQGDHSFNDSAAAGMKKANEDLGATCTEGEAQTGEPESAREDRLRQMADSGYNPVIGIGFSYSEAADNVAPDYPNVNFGVVDGFDPTPNKDGSPNNDNVAYLDFAANEGSFLVGVAAADTTKSDHVGFVGGVHVDLIKNFEAGYVAGAKAVNPNIKVDVKYIEETDLSGFNDPAGGKAAASAMYDNGADVVFQVAGGSGSGVFDAAVDAGEGNWAIGVDGDQYGSAAADQKPHILTSMIKHVDVATFDMIQSIKDGKPLVGYQTYDLKVGGVGYSTSGDFMSQDTIDNIDSYADKIKSGQIKVPTTP
ncbi:MAG TPA: BMP family ABC transporter substrate-binding protein [Nocardioidaceae bacterium]